MAQKKHLWPTDLTPVNFNRSGSNLNCALPNMTLTYPENIRLLGPSSWEEIDSHQTNRRTAHRNSPPSPHMHISPHSFCSFLIPKPRSLRSLGLDNNLKYAPKILKN